jgi:uridine kinase/ribulose-5-phosphate 4-epimerase/fuculose-1-phosphate aldolase
MISHLKKLLYDKTGLFRFAIITSPLFIIGLGMKLYAAAIFGGTNFTTLFIPFTKYFVTTGADPYVHFFTLGITEAFPYPQLMLFILAIPGLLFAPLLSTEIFTVLPSDLLIYHLPILLADITILLILSRWLKHKHTAVLWLYWLSPVLFYINYLHSQLDVIPIAITFAFLYFLFKERWAYALLLLGAAIATKFHIVLLVPFTLIYLWRKRTPLSHICLYSGLAASVFIIFNNFQLVSVEFLQIVFGNREQMKIFDLHLPLGEQSLYLVPIAYILLVLHALTFTRMNRDTFVMFLGFAFGILTLGIPPMQGWYYWILPFFIYFYIKNDHYSKLPLWALLTSYFVYFGVTPNADYFAIFQIVSPEIAAWPNLYTTLTAYGLDAALVHNIALSVLQATLLMNVIWLYQRGVDASHKQKLYNLPYLIGIAGDSGSGKSTLASLFEDLFGSSHTAVVAGDAMHKWERGHSKWQKFTHLDPRANELHHDLRYARLIQSGADVYRRHYDHHSGTFTAPEKLESKTLAIFEGLHAFFLEDMRSALDLKIFIMPEEQLRTHWKVRRDTLERGYTRQTVLAQLKDRAKDAADYITVQEKYADITFSLKSLIELTEETIGTDIEPPVYLEIKCHNTIDLEPLLERLEMYVNIERTVTDTHQVISIAGSISGTVLQHISFTLVPELYDITQDTPTWASNDSGIMQLFVTYYILESLQYRKTDYTLPTESKQEESLLTDISRAAQSIGASIAQVQGGGGNVSYKFNSETMAVKASGLRLEELSERTGFVGIDIATLRRFFNTPRQDISPEKIQAEYDEMITTARSPIPSLPDAGLRPSIETGFHGILDTAVIHTHSVYVNILTCSLEGKQILKTLFPEAAYIPYRTPGVPLTFAISQALKQKPYQIFFLENHGVVVSAPNVTSAFNLHATVNSKIQKWLKQYSDLPDLSISTSPEGVLMSAHASSKTFIQNHHSLLQEFNDTILFPDQVVYGKRFGLPGSGRPIIINPKTGIVDFDVSLKEAQASIETIFAWLYIHHEITTHQLTHRMLSAAEGEVIINLESEKYRQRLIR